ncbi:MAG TPA: type VI secretion system tip protein TssI/VgrG [Acidobacteriota bacterium]|nr:type VI secretion system tip protein TssI/VgrG [Acidobacteriota bacterium]
MADEQTKRFAFSSDALPAETFTVVRFHGEEGLSRCYRFELELVAEDASLDLAAVLAAPVAFTILRAEGDIPFHGVLAGFEQLHQMDNYVFYRAVLVPKLWWLGLTHHNQVFLNQTVPQILAACLKDGGLSSLDFDLRLQRDYPAWEYVCQYRESHLAFVSRWMEREGIYYYFEQGADGEKVILTDTKVAHGPLPDGETLHYSTPSGLQHFHREEILFELRCLQQTLPRRVVLKDYNYETPSLELSGQADVSTKGRGEVYLYGEHFRNPAEGARLAAVRAEELLCRERVFTGSSTVPYLRPGYTFRVPDHYRADFNGTYLTTGLTHEGSQAAYLLAGLGGELTPGEREPYYRNTFTAMAAGVQYRPERVTAKARLYGTLNAKVDGAGSGQYAELDGQGRYKVVLPFDVSGRKDGKASAWVRMMQPYAGAGHGMHFPLHKGTEVLLTFIDGDPDRPVIAGAVPNAETPSVVKDANQTMATIQTGGKNKIAIEDKAGSERILMHVPNQGSFIRIGIPNDPPPGGGPPEPPTTPSPTTATTPPPHDEELSKKVSELEQEIKGIKAETEGDLEFKCHNKKESISGNSFTMVIGAEESIYLGNYTHIKFISAIDVTVGLSLEFKMAWAWAFNVEGHGRFAPQKREFALDVSHMHLKKVDLEGDITHLRGAQQTLTGEVAQLAGQTSILAGTTERLAGKTSQLAGSVSMLAAVTDDIKGSVTTIQGEQAQMLGNDLRSIAVRTTTIGDETNLIGVGLNTVAEKTDLHAENTVLSGLQMLI